MGPPLTGRDGSRRCPSGSRGALLARDRHLFGHYPPPSSLFLRRCLLEEHFDFPGGAMRLARFIIDGRRVGPIPQRTLVADPYRMLPFSRESVESIEPAWEPLVGDFLT